MNDIGVNQVLQQIRAMKVPAAENISEAAKVQGRDDFAGLLETSLNRVNEIQKESGRLSKAFEMGDPNVDLPQVMVAMEKASVSFQAVKEVRNKMVSAYKEVMNMQL